MRLLMASAILLLIARPKVHTWNREKWISAALFGVSLGLMNGFFYAGIEVVPLGPAVTIELVGPLLFVALGTGVLASLSSALPPMCFPSSSPSSRCSLPSSAGSSYPRA